ncbi:mediator complex subunit Med4 [Schizosaccharomyces pombe]|uniref:Mediator of RNA polymerase II transcription subunit 4 n=1 Tax=Schizosaccharomyces pombe (strain 972 / ATCC 24843) TaxID=284812 RepID=MED4_SCHPO|nr:mediator complex subunit Pmc4 [Schizosaccharomyces pombe]Q9Y821.1 RecName: Full=Mediator of RNA polymerase II transcription subunit 4; AltName: Full=Mediator complex subunit 4; AltName: Full=RNA polymerase II mediator complex protein pmc4 [Schizosaccharomyces pombe 972h-]5N9J_G Chain G, Mediator of RNA polymerase II transcription subunit 4 [Schizosaccharomyces pombe]CAB50969.1 mediator complex subunit Pmc4 [Schizosaccharomyces pombe]|eukprot:NP_596462.1 mediator complex subunit Pmc4 [Schizosaccharomyces pombe]
MEYQRAIDSIEECLNKQLRLSSEKVDQYVLIENWTSLVGHLKTLHSLISNYTNGRELQNEISSLLKQDKELDLQIQDCMREMTSIYDTHLPKTVSGRKRQKVNAETLLDYGRKLSKFSSAPPGYNPETGQDAKAPVHYPWPSEDQMRKTLLFQFSTSMVPNLSATASQLFSEQPPKTNEPTETETEIDANKAVEEKTKMNYPASPTFTTQEENKEVESPANKDVFAGFDLFDPEMEEDF